MALTSVQAIKKFFSTDDRPVTMAELKELSTEARQELGKLACDAMGVEFQPTKQK